MTHLVCSKHWLSLPLPVHPVSPFDADAYWFPPVPSDESDRRDVGPFMSLTHHSKARLMNCHDLAQNPAMAVFTSVVVHCIARIGKIR
jgi:hypothetical protein